MALPPPRQTQHGLAPPPDVALEPTMLMPGTEPTMLMPGTEPTMLMPGTEPTLVQPGTEPTLVQPGTEPTLVQPGTEPTLVQPGTEPTLVQPGTAPTPIDSPLRNTPGYRGPDEVGFLLQAYRALRSVDPEAAEALLRGRGFESVADLLAYESAAAQYSKRLRLASGAPDPRDLMSLNQRKR